MKSLEAWRWENSEPVLRQALLGKTSYPEYAVIVHRLRELTNKGDQNVEWEEQELGGSLLADLKAHPGQLRALFVNGSPFSDEIVYAEHKRIHCPKTTWISAWKDQVPEQLKAFTNTPITHKEMSVSDEEIRAHCEKTGTTNGPSVAVLKDYLLPAKATNLQWKKGKGSKFCLFAHVEPGEGESLVRERMLAAGGEIEENILPIDDYQTAGKRFVVTRPKGVFLHYVPHDSIGSRKLKRWKHSMRWRGGDLALVRERIEESFESHRVRVEDVLVSIDHYDKPDRSPRVLLMQKNRLGPKRREVMERACENGALAYLGKDSRYARHTQVLYATEQRINQFPQYYKQLEDGSWMYHRAWLAKERLLNAAEKLSSLDIKLSFESEWSDAPQRGVGSVAEENWKLFRGALGQTGQDLDKDLINILSIVGVDMLWEHESCEVTRHEKIEHDAPFSERGVLRIDNLEPAEGLELLAALGLIETICSLVPYQSIYRGRHRRGRVLPWHPDYALQAQKLSLPPGQVIMHGLTGIGKEGAVGRLRQILETGGLKSIAERRRMGCLIPGTMSPAGDTQSGTDVGVPTRISANGSPGNSIYFVMKPGVLQRRDLWFAPQDYGGGGNRYEMYNTYAQQIGQGKIHHTAPHKARVKHLQGDLGGSNELYLKHEIPWDEVEALMVHSSFYEEACLVVKKVSDGIGVQKGITQWVKERPREELVCL
jgi:hypothetical protein